MPDFSKYTEQEIIELAAAGDEQAFTRLFFLYHQHLGSFVYQLTGDRDLAEEAVQEVFIKIWHNREQLSEIRNFKSWLFRISKNHTLNLLRSSVREKLRQAEWERMQPADEQPLDQEQFEMAMRAIEQLPPQQQKVFVLSRIRKMKYHEIASVLKISKETVKSYLKLASTSITRFVNSNSHFWTWIQIMIVYLAG